MKHTSVRAALQYVANYPQPVTDEHIQLPVHELICRSLFDLANNPDVKVRGSYAKANKARKMIMDRLDGKRRAGSHPARKQTNSVEFIDLTMHQIGAPDEPEA